MTLNYYSFEIFAACFNNSDEISTCSVLYVKTVIVVFKKELSLSGCFLILVLQKFFTDLTFSSPIKTVETGWYRLFNQFYPSFKFSFKTL